MPKDKPITWMGSSLNDLRAFPEKAMDNAGYQLNLVQNGFDPDDYKPFPQIGSGVREIRIRDETGAYRVIYVAKFSDAIYVLHAFQKKTQKTSKQDIDIAKARYKAISEQ
ncbi:MAG: type II toxin-antitoxin system RelE/ParE family toxin [Gammaproteobacteria bacterium]|nr:MAG: type II toxin-antitoxin system RelE/ParE family toxin [Gammaproteobacteria bacterium]